MVDFDAVKETSAGVAIVKRDCACGISADQVSLDRGVNRSIVLYAADRDAVACRVDDVAGAGCAATNCDSGPNLDIDAPRLRADRCRSRSIGADIVALHQRVVAGVVDQYSTVVAGDHIACARRCAADRGAGRE